MHRLSIRGWIVVAALMAAGCAWIYARQLVSTNVAGGRGGRTFADFQVPADARVAEVRIRSGERIDAVQMMYVLSDGSSLAGPQHGGSGGRVNVFRLDSDEYITGLSGRYGETIDSLRIETNKRTSALFGGRGGNTDFRVDAPSGHYAVGFAGRAGDYLDAIGLICTPLAAQVSTTITAGGGGGNEFTDSRAPAGASVAEVRIWAGEYVDSVQMVYLLPNGRILPGARHGGTGGNSYVFRLNPGEYIIGISGRHGKNIDSLTIHTNRRSSQAFGGRGGDRNFRIDVPAGNQAVGFTGRAGIYLDAIGLTHTRPGRGRR